MRLRVLHLMSCRGWSSDAYWAGRIARELAARGHRVTFVARAGTDAKVLDRLRALGVAELCTLPFAGRRAPGALLRDLRAIARWLGEHDVVHVHRGKEHWLAALAAARVRGAPPLVRTRHIVQPVGRHPLNRWLYRRTAHVIAVSEAIRQQYLAAGLVPPERVTTLHGGVDERRFSPAVDGRPFRAAHGLAPEVPVVGVLGGLRAMKGHRVFLAAARRVRERAPACRFVLAGDGPERPAIRAEVERLALTGAVVLAGYVPEPEQAVAAFDVAVYPSLSSEGMGRVVFEYLATGRPIVASRVGVAAEVLKPGESAVLVPPGDPDSLADAILGLLEDRDAAAALGRAGRRLVEAHYSGAVVAAAVERLYAQALDAGGRA